MSAAWVEAEPSGKVEKGYFQRYKFRFEWVESQGDPWWEDGVDDGTSLDIGGMEIQPVPRGIGGLLTPPGTPMTDLPSPCRLDLHVSSLEHESDYDGESRSSSPRYADESRRILPGERRLNSFARVLSELGESKR